jgi:hypothetical protein
MTWTADASFNSPSPLPSIRRAACRNSFGTAYTGPIPTSAGSMAATAIPRYRPRGLMPRRAAAASSITTRADDPSDNALALPAVMMSTALGTRLGAACPWSEVSGRLRSSRRSTT